MGAIHFSIDESLLLLFSRELPIQTFVETGTFKGESLQVARKFFPECHSVEMSPEHFSAAQKLFAGDRGVHLNSGDSPTFLLRSQAAFVAKPVLFWLDAHWCSGEHTAGANAQSPLLAELQAIKRLHSDSVILIDDARLYLCPPGKPHRYSDWPSFHEILQALLALSSQHRVMVCNDVILFFPAHVDAAVSAHAQEHAVDWLGIVRDATKRRNKTGGKKWRFFRRRS